MQDCQHGCVAIFPVATRGTAVKKFHLAQKAFIPIHHNTKIKRKDWFLNPLWCHKEHHQVCDTIVAKQALPSASSHTEDPTKHRFEWKGQTEHFVKEAFKHGATHAVSWNTWRTCFGTQTWGAPRAHLFLHQPQTCGSCDTSSKLLTAHAWLHSYAHSWGTPHCSRQNNKKNWYRAERTIAGWFWRFAEASWRMSQDLAWLLLLKTEEAKTLKRKKKKKRPAVLWCIRGTAIIKAVRRWAPPLQNRSHLKACEGSKAKGSIIQCSVYLQAGCRAVSSLAESCTQYGRERGRQ